MKRAGRELTLASFCRAAMAEKSTRTRPRFTTTLPPARPRKRNRPTHSKPQNNWGGSKWGMRKVFSLRLRITKRNWQAMTKEFRRRGETQKTYSVRSPRTMGSLGKQPALGSLSRRDAGTVSWKVLDSPQKHKSLRKV